MEHSIILKQIDEEKLTEIVRDSVKSVVSDINPQKSKKPTVYVSRKEASEFLKISLPSLNLYTKQGILIGYRMGGRILYKISEIELVLEQNSTCLMQFGIFLN